MNILDILCACIVGYMLIRGLARGILIEVFSLAGLVVGFILAKKFYIIPVPYIERVVNAPGWASIISFLLIFMLTILVFTLVAKALKRILTLAFVGWADHLFGGFLGVAKGLIVSCVALALITTFMPEAAFMQGSVLAPWLSQLSEFLRQFLPEQTIL